MNVTMGKAINKITIRYAAAAPVGPYTFPSHQINIPAIKPDNTPGIVNTSFLCARKYAAQH